MFFLSSLNLHFECTFIFELCPYKVGVFSVLGKFEPESFFDNALNQITIIAEANVDFERCLVLFNIQFPIYAMTQVY